MSPVQVVRVGSGPPTVVVSVTDSSPVAVVPVAGGSVSGPGESWWAGEGPPPELVVGAKTGDWYWDITTGDVYELTEGA